MSTRRGFSFIEILIVVAIIGILATLALTSYVHQAKKGRDAQRKSDFQKFRVYLEDYYNDFGCYPPQALLTCDGAGMKPYIAKVACEPKTHSSYVYVPAAGACPNSYWFYTNLEYKQDPEIKESGCATGCGAGNAYNFRYGSTNAQ
ncbi:MAG: type II secretion system protein [bacterium]|nr:type II secretion system protein [bacterium]